MSDLKSVLESILFVEGEPISVARLAKATGASKQDIETGLQELQSEYALSSGRGIILLKNNGEWQFATNPANKEVIETLQMSGQSEDLTKAGVEVLSIIAYKGPMTRAEVEYIRGVNSSFIIRNLLLRGLVLREDNPKDKRSYLYQISHDFLKHLGLTRREDLPEFKSFSEHVIEIQNQDESAESSL